MIDLLTHIMSINDPDLVESVAKSFQNFPIHLHCKDRKGRYLDFNEQVMIDAGFSESTDFRGLTDLDFTFLKEDEALKIQHRDAEVISKDQPNFHMGTLNLCNKTAQEISIKKPLKSKRTNKIIGVLTCAFVLPENSLLHEEFFRKNNEKVNLDFNNSFQILSRREKQCLKLYLSGETARQTASTLGLSQRTIDDYINSIKKKLKCERKRDLIKLFYIE